MDIKVIKKSEMVMQKGMTHITELWVERIADCGWETLSLYNG